MVFLPYASGNVFIVILFQNTEKEVTGFKN